MRKNSEVALAEEAEVVETTPAPSRHVRILSVTDTDEYELLTNWYLETFPAAGDAGSADVHARIVGGIMALDDNEDPLAVAESLDSASDWIGIPIVLQGVQSVMPSDYGGIYAVVEFARYSVDSRSAQGPTMTMTVGAPQMLAQLQVLYRRGKLHGAVCKVAPIKRGGKQGRNAPLYFRPVDY